MSLPFSEISGYERGQDVGDFAKNLAIAARDTACDLYRAFPNGVIPSAGDPFGVGDFNKGLWDSFCKKIPPQRGQRFSRPFGGGQCPVLYAVSMTYSFDGGPNGSDTVTTSPPTNVLGPITDGWVDIIQGEGDSEFQQAYVVLEPGSTPVPVASGQPVQKTTSAVLNVQRIDGQPDTCGNPPLPDPGDLTPIPPPQAVRYVPVPTGPGLPPVVFPIIPIIGPNIFRPEININVGPININVGPINIDFDLNFDIPSPPPPLLPPPALPPGVPQPKPLPPGGGGGVSPPQLEVDLSEVLRLLRDVKECACEPDEDVVITAIAANTIGGVFSLPSNTKFLRLTLTQEPSNKRVQFGNNNAPDVVYAGWLSFGRDDHWSHRDPVHYQLALYPVPDEMPQVSFTVYNGFRATASAVRFIPRNP